MPRKSDGDENCRLESEIEATSPATVQMPQLCPICGVIRSQTNRSSMNMARLISVANISIEVD